MIEKNYDLKEALSRNLTDDFQMHDHDGKYNFYIKPTINIKGDHMGYDIHLGKNYVGGFSSIDKCIKFIKRNFIQTRKGNGLIPRDDCNIIKIEFN